MSTPALPELKAPAQAYEKNLAPGASVSGPSTSDQLWAQLNDGRIASYPSSSAEAFKSAYPDAKPLPTPKNGEMLVQLGDGRAATIPATSWPVLQQQDPKATIKAGEAPVQQAPPETGVVAGVERAAKNIAHLPGQLWDAVSQGPQNEEEQLVHDAGISGPVGSIPPGQASLIVHRLVIAPSLAASQKGEQYEKLASVEQDPKIKKQLLDAADTYKKAAYLPVVGPMAAQMAERAAYGPQGASQLGANGKGGYENSNSDLTGATAEALTYSAVPKLQEEATGLLSKGAGAALERTGLSPTVERVEGAGEVPIPLRGQSSLAKFADTSKLKNMEVNETQPAVRQAAGTLAADAAKTDVPLEAPGEQDAFGFKSAAKQLGDRTQSAFQKIDELSGGKLSDAQAEVEAARGSLDFEGKKAYQAALSKQEAIFDQYANATDASGQPIFDPGEVQNLKASWRQKVGLEELATRFNRTVRPTPVELTKLGAPDAGYVDANAFRNAVIDADQLGEFKKAGFSEYHVQALKDLGNILERAKPPAVGGLLTQIGNTAVKSIAGGVLGYLKAGPVGALAGTVASNWLAGKVLGSIMTDFPSVRLLSAGLATGANPTAVAENIAKQPGFISKFASQIKQAYENSPLSREEGAVGRNITPRKVGSGVTHVYNPESGMAEPVEQSGNSAASRSYRGVDPRDYRPFHPEEIQAANERINSAEQSAGIVDKNFKPTPLSQEAQEHIDALYKAAKQQDPSLSLRDYMTKRGQAAEMEAVSGRGQPLTSVDAVSKQPPAQRPTYVIDGETGSYSNSYRTAPESAGEGAPASPLETKPTSLKGPLKEKAPAPIPDEDPLDHKMAEIKDEIRWLRKKTRPIKLGNNRVYEVPIDDSVRFGRLRMELDAYREYLDRISSRPSLKDLDEHFANYLAEERAINHQMHQEAIDAAIHRWLSIPREESIPQDVYNDIVTRVGAKPIPELIKK